MEKLPTVSRAIRIKLIVPRGPDGLKIRTALMDTHRTVHEAIRFCEEMLLTFRQGAVSFDAAGQEISSPASYYIARLEEHFKKIKLPKAKWERAKELLRKLYTLLVRSSVGQTSSDSDIEGFFRPLFQASEGARPKPIHLLVNGLIPSEDERKIAELCEDQKLVSTITGLFEKDPSLTKNKKPSWDTLYHTQELDEKTGRPKWIKAFFNDWQSALKRFGGREDIVGELKEMGLLPFQKSYFNQTFPGSVDNLWLWDRMALARAIGHLNSWESWSRNVAEEKEKLRLQVGKAIEIPIEPAALDILEGYQEKHGWKIRGREIRGWDKLREWLQKHPKAKTQQITDRIGAMQRRRSEYGSGLFLAWAASEPLLWKTDRDPVRTLAKRNGIQEKYERARRYARFTYTSYNKHPTGVDYDIPSNANNPKYELSLEGKRLFVTIPLFYSGQLQKTKFACAPSRQLRNMSLDRSSKGIPYLTTATQDNLGREETFTEQSPENKGREKWAAGGAALTFERSAIAGGRMRDVYLRIARKIEIQPKALKQKTDIARWFSKTAGARVTPPDLTGTVCLAVDLNQRAAAAVSAFRIIKEHTPGAQSNCASLGNGWVAVPLYSRVLRLPGEGRKNALGKLRPELNKIRNEISLLKALRKLTLEKDEAKRDKLISLFASSGVEISDPQEAYKKQADLIAPMLPKFKTLIREQLVAKRSLGGVSLQRIEFLEDYLDVLKSWFFKATPERTRTERKNFGWKLRVKTQKLKEDRAKKTADAITQAARGFYWSEKNGWEKAGPPATFVVMEELRSFLPIEERTPSQNRRLARWNHRTATKYLGFQLAEYAIPLVTTTASYTSLFEGKGTPGIRCRPLTKKVLTARGSGGWLDKRLGPDELNLTPEEIQNLKPGDLIPDRGAAVFVTLHRSALGKRYLVSNNADTSAASRIGLNFLTGYKEPVYVKCAPGENDTLESSGLGTRLSLYFGSSAMLFLPEGGGIYTPTPLKTKKAITAPVEEEAEEDEGHRVLLLRDPTGVFFHPHQWVERGRFFGQIRSEILAALRKNDFFPRRRK